MPNYSYQTSITDPNIQLRQGDLGVIALEQRVDPLCSSMVDFLLRQTLPLDNSKLRETILNEYYKYMVDDYGVLRRIDVISEESIGPPAVLLRNCKLHCPRLQQDTQTPYSTLTVPRVQE